MIAQIKIVPTASFATKIDKSKITKEMLAKVSKRSPRCGAFYCKICNTFTLFYIVFSLQIHYIINTR